MLGGVQNVARIGNTNRGLVTETGFGPPPGPSHARTHPRTHTHAHTHGAYTHTHGAHIHARTRELNLGVPPPPPPDIDPPRPGLPRARAHEEPGFSRRRTRAHTARGKYPPALPFLRRYPPVRREARAPQVWGMARMTEKKRGISLPHQSSPLPPYKPLDRHPLQLSSPSVSFSACVLGRLWYSVGVPQPKDTR